MILSQQHVRPKLRRRHCIDTVRMRWNAPSGSQLWAEEGSGENIWAPRNSGNIIHSASAQEGDGALILTSGGNQLTCPWGAHNAFSGTGEWFIGFWLFVPSGGGTSRYYVSVQDGTPTAAGTAFAIITNASRQLGIVDSDGVTRSVNVSATTVTQNAWQYILLERVGNNLKLSKDGTVIQTRAFAGSINLPSGQSLFVGAPVFAGGSTDANVRYDLLQVRRSSVFGGVGFTPPTTFIP